MTDTTSGDEKRRDVEIRQLFVEAYDILEPFFDPANQWAGHGHEHLAYRALHEHFPKLSGDQIFIIVDAARRVFASGGKPAP
ncbi:MAG: hypothetical protein OEL88_15950 [Sterolibacteriaceae bacterium MAG5]|nr:hypothetical protein [Candidatus Nitricoxidireducens bremensis]